MKPSPYSLKYVNAATRWCLTYFVEDKVKKSDKRTQRQEWFEEFSDAEKRAKELFS